MTQQPEPVVGERAWARLTCPPPPPGTPPAAAAAEAWYTDGVAVALAWRHPSHAPGGTPRCIVAITGYPDAGQAASVLRACGAAVLLAGKSLTRHPALATLHPLPVGGRTCEAVRALRRMIAAGVLWHDGGQLLTGQRGRDQGAG